MANSYQRLGANTEARISKDGDDEYLYLRIKLREGDDLKTLGRSNSGKSERIATTGGNVDLGIISDDYFDTSVGLNIYKPIPKEERE